MFKDVPFAGHAVPLKATFCIEIDGSFTSVVSIVAVGIQVAMPTRADKMARACILENLFVEA